MNKIVFSDHARFQMQRRGISENDVRGIIHNPGQTEEVRPGRVVFQAQLMKGEPAKKFLVRVFIDVGEASLEVVTVYLTSRIEKYWR